MPLQKFVSVYICYKVSLNMHVGNSAISSPGPFANWGERSEPRIGEVNANSVCMYVIDRPTDRPTGRIAHAQKHAKHM